MKLKYLLTLLLGGLLLVGCTSTPPSKNRTSSVEKKSSTPPSSSPSKAKKNFNYEKYVEKHKLIEKAKSKEKKNSQYKKMLESMARELRENWKKNQQKAQTFYNKALSFHHHLELKKAKDSLVQALKIYPSYKEALALQKRVLFLLGERRALIKETLTILQEERKLFDTERIPYFKELFYQGELFQKEGKDREARELFELVVSRCRFAKSHQLLSEPGMAQYLKWESFLANLLKREKKL